MLLRLSVIIMGLGAPFLAYWLRTLTSARLARGAIRPWPIAHLFLIGTLLCGVSLVVLALDKPNQAGRIFVPSHLENGVLKQGHFERSAP